MYIKIYFDTKPLFLCDTIEPEIEPYVHHDDTVLIDELNPHTVKSMLHEMQQPRIHAGVFVDSDFERLKKAFWKKFTIIQAAGGLIANQTEDVLLIFRRGFWDLPKGKLDLGESLEQCALREVQEETGLHNVHIVSPLLVTYHTYHEGTRFILKESHWYHMKALEAEELIPQTEEDIHEIKWVPRKEVASFIPLTYPSIADVFKSGSLV